MQTESKSLNPIYKVVRVEDGHYFSIYIGSKQELKGGIACQQLEYALGRVTTCDSLLGIFVYPDLDRVKHDYTPVNSRLVFDHSLPLAVLECYPVGYSTGNYIAPGQVHSLLPVREVYRIEPHPEPKYSIGQEVMFANSIHTVDFFEQAASATELYYKYTLSRNGSVRKVRESNLHNITWVDITAQCKQEIRESLRSQKVKDDSIYFRILHSGGTAVIYNPITNSMEVKEGFKLTPATGATFSFNILKAISDAES